MAIEDMNIYLLFIYYTNPEEENMLVILKENSVFINKTLAS